MFLLLQACSLFTTIEPLECERASDCIDTFGFGNTCQADGYCSNVQAIPRCETTNPPDFWSNQSAYRDAFVMGQMFDFEADASKLAASTLAFNDILETGPMGAWLDGKPLVQITCNYQNNAGDSLTEKDAVETVTEFLINTMGVEVIVGPAGSQDTLYATNLSNRRALFISPSATAQSLKPIDTVYSDDDPGLFWRTTGPDTLQSKRLEDYLQERNLNNVAILYQTSIYGRGIGTTLRDLREESMGEVPATDTFEINVPDSIPGKINSLLSDESIEALVFISDSTTDLMQAITTMRTSGYETIPLLLTDSAAKVELLSAIKEYTGGNTELEASIANQITGTKPSVPSSSQYDEFISRLNNVHGVDAQSSVFTAHSYDATWLAATAILYAHRNESPHDINGLARGLRKISGPIHPQIELSTSGWNQIKDRLSSNQTVNILGTSGDLDYDSETEELVTSVDLWKMVENLTTFEIIENDDDDDDDDDTGDTGDTTIEISPDTIEISFKHGYDGFSVVNVAYGVLPTDYNGDFTINMIDSLTGEQCSLRWVLNNQTVSVDPNFTNDMLLGSLIDGVNAMMVNAWYGYIISGIPTIEESCDNLDVEGQALLNQFIMETPGFGYAPLSDSFVDLYADMAMGTINWLTIKDEVVAGLVSFTAFTSDGNRMYYPINQTFVYKVLMDNTPWTTTWSPLVTTIPQSNTMTVTGHRNPSGFYVSESYFSFDTPFE